MSWEVYIFSCLCVFVSCFFGPVLFLTANLPFLIIAIIDLHLRRMYRISVLDAAPWISMLILDTNRTEIYEYLLKINIMEYVLLFLIPLSVLFARIYRPSRKVPKSFYLIFWLAFPMSYISHLYPTVEFFSASEKKSVLRNYKNFSFAPTVSEKAAQNVILIIGESHRYGEFQESFRKYEKKFASLYNFSDFISNYANTMDAVPVILSRKKFQKNLNFFHEKSLFSLFEEAGYETYFLHYTNSSNITEKNNLSFIYNEARHFINFSSKDDSFHDIRIRHELKKILAEKEQKKLIVIKMIGDHIDFEYRYPAPYDTRKPSLKGTKEAGFWKKIRSKTHLGSFYSPENKEAILNTYKNATDYSVEIIQNLFDLAKEQPASTLTVFSSDHGICIFDKAAFHIPPDCKEAFHIPVLFYLNPALSKTVDAEKVKNLFCNVDKPLTQEYLFETIVSLAGFSYPAANKEYDLTKKCFFSPVKRNVDLLLNGQFFYEDL